MFMKKKSSKGITYTNVYIHPPTFTFTLRLILNLKIKKKGNIAICIKEWVEKNITLIFSYLLNLCDGISKSEREKRLQQLIHVLCFMSVIYAKMLYDDEE
jgi:hypothetical protein